MVLNAAKMLGTYLRGPQMYIAGNCALLIDCYPSMHFLSSIAEPLHRSAASGWSCAFSRVPGWQVELDLLHDSSLASDINDVLIPSRYFLLADMSGTRGRGQGGTSDPPPPYGERRCPSTLLTRRGTRPLTASRHGVATGSHRGGRDTRRRNTRNLGAIGCHQGHRTSDAGGGSCGGGSGW